MLFFSSQSILSAPLTVEEPVHPELSRGLLDSILSALSVAGQEVLSSAINGVASTGGNLISSAFGALNSVPGLNGHPINIQQGLNGRPINIQQDEELLDMFNALADEMYSEQPPIFTSEPIPNSQVISQDEMPIELVDEHDEHPVYIVVLE